MLQYVTGNQTENMSFVVSKCFTVMVYCERYVARLDEFAVQQKLLTYLVFQLVARHHLNACDISTSACDKVQLIRV